MLDKEPRWLHPKTNTDMDRRVAELSNSPTRSPRTSSVSTGRPHSFSDPMPYLSSAPSFNVETATRPSTRNASPAGDWSASAPYPGLNASGYHAHAPEFLGGSAQTSRGSTASPNEGLGLDHNDLFGVFLRQTTFMSSSTDQTTGSFHRVLSGYSEPYIRTVRRLVKRFTLPNNNNRQSVSPISERPEPAQTSWVDDDDAPSVYRERPYPLPGDFLNMGPSFQQPHTPANQEFSNSPWTMGSLLTQDGDRILSYGITQADVNVCDDFGNTVLHFLVARGTIGSVIGALRIGLCAPIINAQNSAGQTFLHLATRTWLENTNCFNQLVNTLMCLNFDFYTRDHYGRNIFHVLRQEEVEFSHILQCFDLQHYAKRDAFNVVPRSQFEFTDAMDVDYSTAQQGIEQSPEFAAVADMIQDSKLLRYVRLCQQTPQLEDGDGRNGLHCLAMASLSMRHVSEVSLLPTTPDTQRRRSQGPDNNLDSSEHLLQRRLAYINDLLDSRVDPNHYDHQGNTPLMAFAAQLPEDDDYKTGPKILETLLDRGAEINARNRAGETALHIAVRCGRKLAVRTLVKRGANVFARDAAGRSVLDVADIKMANLIDDDPRAYAHFEACRAWLSGQGHAVQQPTAIQEWRAVRS